MMQSLYDQLLATVVANTRTVDELCLGLTWTYCRSGDSLGLAMSPGVTCRTLPWAGTLRGKTVAELAPWLLSWNPFEACVGLAAANAAINHAGNSVLDRAEPVSITSDLGANLAVFEHFRPRLAGAKVVIVGRYPGLDRITARLQVQVLERMPGEHDLPDTAAEFVLPHADWVFITASALINKTLPRLLALSQHATTVLMGPSLPWLAEWRQFGVDYLAGVKVLDADKASQIVREGGGVRLFGEGVGYAIADLSSFS